MIKINETESIEMYNEYGISEWREKCLLLTDIARIAIVDDLKKGVESPLVALAKLPFPNFVVTYLKTFNKNAIELNDPAFGYRLYLMEDIEMQYHFQYAKDKSQKKKDVYSSIGASTNYRHHEQRVREFLYAPLEDISKLMSGHDHNLILRKKWMYISQYITAEEAEKMDLKGYEFKDHDTYKDCELESKLDLLNAAGRIIVARYIGLYGHFRKPIEEISKELHVPHGTVTKYLDFVFPLMFRSVGEVNYALQVVPSSLEPGKTRMYANPTAKDIDVRTQLHFIRENILSDNEKLLLSGYSYRQGIGYIARKYMFDNPKDIMDYMEISPKEIPSPQAPQL